MKNSEVLTIQNSDMFDIATGNYMVVICMHFYDACGFSFTIGSYVILISYQCQKCCVELNHFCVYCITPTDYRH